MRTGPFAFTKRFGCALALLLTVLVATSAWPQATGAQDQPATSPGARADKPALPAAKPAGSEPATSGEAAAGTAQPSTSAATDTAKKPAGAGSTGSTATDSKPPAAGGSLAPTAGAEDAWWWVFGVITTLLGLMFFAVASSLFWADNRGSWSLADAVSEESTYQPHVITKKSDVILVASSSRLIAVIGLLGILVVVLGSGYAIVWNLFMKGEPPQRLGDLRWFLYGAATLFAPYLANQVRAAFDTPAAPAKPPATQTTTVTATTAAPATPTPGSPGTATSTTATTTVSADDASTATKVTGVTTVVDAASAAADSAPEDANKSAGGPVPPPHTPATTTVSSGPVVAPDGSTVTASITTPSPPADPKQNAGVTPAPQVAPAHVDVQTAVPAVPPADANKGTR